MTREIIQELTELNQKLKAQIQKLNEYINELERRLGLDSSNSSKPPSSDGLRKKPAPLSLREKSGKNSGGQKNHVGKTLMQVENPDRIIKHEITKCECCSHDLTNIKIEKCIKRQIFDIPKPKVLVDEHQSFVKICPCGHTNTAKFPENVTGPVGYGPHIKSTAVYLSVQQMIPEDRLKQTFEDVFKLPISTATLTKISSRFAEKAEPIQEKVLVTLKKAKRKNADESGFRIGGKTNWLQNLSNKTHTYYKPTEKRGDVFKEGLSGILVHDHFKPYNMIKTVQHAFCNAHHLRELKALRDIEKEEWASKMYQLLCGANRCENPSKARVIKTYDRILKEGFHFHEAQMPLSKRKNKRRVGHNLLIRLRDHKEGTLRFLTDRQCPFTNNQAEQDIRMMKVKQKISGGFRTMKGAKIFCTIRGFLSTSRKQGCNIFGAIHLMHSPCR